MYLPTRSDSKEPGGSMGLAVTADVEPEEEAGEAQGGGNTGQTRQDSVGPLGAAGYTGGWR